MLIVMLMLMMLMLIKHSQEIKIFIFNRNIDLLLVSETHFTNSYCCISGYTLYYTMHFHGKTYGGTALNIRSDIKYYEIGKFQREFM